MSRTPYSPRYEAFARVIEAIPRGKVMTYGQVAVAAGYPNGARQVGYALHAVGGKTWFRVLGRKRAGVGKITTAGSTAVEQRLRLEAEGVLFGPSGSIDLARFGHTPGIRKTRPRVG